MLEPNEAKLSFSRSMTDMEGGFITSSVCHNYGIMSGCDEGCPALLSGDCEVWKEALSVCNFTNKEKLEIKSLYR